MIYDFFIRSWALVATFLSILVAFAVFSGFITLAFFVIIAFLVVSFFTFLAALFTSN